MHSVGAAEHQVQATHSQSIDCVQEHVLEMVSMYHLTSGYAHTVAFHLKGQLELKFAIESETTLHLRASNELRAIIMGTTRKKNKCCEELVTKRLLASFASTKPFAAHDVLLPNDFFA